MAEKSVKELMEIHGRAKTDRERWRHLYRDAYRYTQPARDTVDNPQRGQRRFDVVFDSTGVKSTQKAANRLQDLLFPTGKNILEPVPGPAFEEVDEAARQEIADRLQEVNEKWHAALWRSNFQSVINEGLQDILIGTLSVLFNEGPPDDPFHFTAVPQFSINFAEGPWGTIWTVSREVRLTPKVAKQQWPQSNISETDQGNASEGDGDKRVYVEITYPDDDSIMVPDGELMGTPTKWFYTVIDVEKEAKIFENDREIEVMSPWIVGRWQKTADETRGRGPVLAALADIRTANKVVELVLKNASLAVTGIWTAVDDGVFNPNTAKFQSGSFIPVRSNGGTLGPSIAPLEFPGNFDVSQLILADMREQIKEALFDNNLPPVNAPVRTATEFIARLRDLTMDIGPAAGRIHKEILEPLYLRGLHILRRKQLVDLPDDLRLDSQSITLNIVSPLAQRQALDNIQKVVQWLELSTFLGPELVHLKVKTDALPQYFGEELGVPADLMRTPAGQEQVMAAVGQIIAASQVQAGANGQATPAGPTPAAA